MVHGGARAAAQTKLNAATMLHFVNGQFRCAPRAMMRVAFALCPARCARVDAALVGKFLHADLHCPTVRLQPRAWFV
eukprot:9731200-Alexandrium_andersonii.AAC.1